MTHGFNLEYGDGYNITNNSNLHSALHVRNDLAEGTKVGNNYQSIWNICNDSIGFKPLEDGKKIREYIEIPEKIVNDKTQPLKLIKSVRKESSNVIGSGGNIEYNLR